MSVYDTPIKLINQIIIIANLNLFVLYYRHYTYEVEMSTLQLINAITVIMAPVFTIKESAQFLSPSMSLSPPLSLAAPAVIRTTDNRDNLRLAFSGKRRRTAFKIPISDP